LQLFQIAAMQALVEEAMQAGAIGLSTGTFYPPAVKATTEEIIEVGRPLTSRKALYVTHMRDEADRVMESLEETFAIGRALDIPVVVSHHKVQNVQNHGKTKVTLPFIQEAMKHQCIGLDCYPYTAGSTMIRTDRGMMDGRVLIASSVPHPECAGRDLKDIAADWGVSGEEAAKRLQPGSAIYFMMDEDDVQRILAFDETMIGSDGIPLGEKPHPRLWGTFPRVLGYVFKPVSFWYAHRRDGSLAAVLAEVNNTFGERHAYLLAGPDLAWGREQVARKQFHVSPFCEVRGEYRFRFERSEKRTLARVDLHDENGPLLQTSVGGTLHPLDAATVRRAFFGTPLMTLGVIARIHWQALRLWAKRLPFHGKPTEPERFVTR
jgi:hypothetical protein